jgi:cyclase
LHNKGLTKTEKFKTGKYIGDPINAVRIFNEKEVDELMFLDIDKTTQSKEPDFELIQKIADESRMPVCYGGGIKNSSQAKEIIEMGIEKIALSSIFFENPEIINETASIIGAQSVLIVLDVKKKSFSSDYNVYTHNGTKKRGSLKSMLNDLEKYHYGELVINSIDLDGSQQGYDISLAELCRENTDKPLTILGGAGSLDDIKSLIQKFKIIGVAAGSLFVFKGKYKAVLINYPSFSERKNLYE